MIESSYSEAIKRKYPEPVVLVVSCDSKGKPDVMPAGWAMITSGTPPMLAVSIGLKRYTHQLLKETGEFVLVFPSEGMRKLIDSTGSCSGRNVDKFEVYGVETLKAKQVAPPLIKNSVACFECKVKADIETGDHTIFVGEVVASHISPEYEDRLYNFGNNEFEIIKKK